MAVYWSSFRGCLKAHFNSLHYIIANREKGRFELVQNESVFSDCFVRRLYVVGSLARDLVGDQDRQFPAICAGNFTATLIDTFPFIAVENGRVKVDMKYSPYVERMLRHSFNFFIPALAWAYTELKKHIIRADSIISKLEKRNANQRYLAGHPKRISPRRGTGELRWRNEVTFRSWHGSRGQEGGGLEVLRRSTRHREDSSLRRVNV